MASSNRNTADTQYSSIIFWRESCKVIPPHFHDVWTLDPGQEPQVQFLTTYYASLCLNFTTHNFIVQYTKFFQHISAEDLDLMPADKELRIVENLKYDWLMVTKDAKRREKYKKHTLCCPDEKNISWEYELIMQKRDNIIKAK